MQIRNHITLVLHPEFAALHDWMLSLPERFRRGEGKLIHDGRNQLRELTYEGQAYVVKSYRRPHIINRYVYGTLRPSKAKRAYDNALMLLRIGIGTPQPVGYLNLRSGLAFAQSYNVTKASACPYRYEDLLGQNFPDADEILQAIARTTAELHEHELHNKDYSRGNILFGRAADGRMHIELVDLNRIVRRPLDVRAGCRNFDRLPATIAMRRVMATAYAEARGFDPDECYDLMREYRARQPERLETEEI